MNPEKQRIAIAQACGKLCAFSGMPDYLNDLNAMHEAGKCLTREQQSRYHSALITLIGTGPDPDQLIVCATAAQRAEAFLKTIRKWEEE